MIFLTNRINKKSEKGILINAHAENSESLPLTYLLLIVVCIHFLLSVPSSDPTHIQGFGNLCVKPSADGTQLVYSTSAGCQSAAAKFSLSQKGVLKQHSSGKKICPKGGRGGYGVPLVISHNCDETQSKFERTSGKRIIYSFVQPNNQRTNQLTKQLIN